jgi:quercetin dioxygenase-like cupin family protein
MENNKEVDEKLVSTVSNINELIQYQTGSVVSRTIIKKPTGTVTIFAFDEGEGLSEHSAPFDALVQVIDGEVEVSISKKPYKVKAGELIIMPANEPHALKAISKFKMVLTMVKN